MPIALSIAGYDPSSGAGITADLMVFAAHGLFGISAVTALTVQSTAGVQAVQAVDADILARTLDEVARDLPPAGIKVGMLGSRACVEVVADFLERVPRRLVLPVVLDPVLVSSSGAPLLDPAGVDAMIDRLLPLASWITPNRAEFARLMSAQELADEAELEGQMKGFRVRWPHAGLVVTGGDGDRADDLLLLPVDPAPPPADLISPPTLHPGQRAPVWLRAEKIASRATHGTGCAFSSALLCGLLRGQTPLQAAAAAKHYVEEAIRQAVPLGQGRGPMRLLWPLSGAPAR